jgi:hypothetical protein
MSQHPSSKGALFINTDKSREQHPDFRGDIAVSAEQIQRLIHMGQQGLEVKLSISGWNNVSQKTGQQYIGLVAQAYTPPVEQPQYPPAQQQYQQPPAQGYQQQPPQAAPQPPTIPAAPQHQPPPVQPPEPPPAAPGTYDSFNDDIPF